MITFLALILVFFATLVGAVGSVFMKKGAGQFDFNIIHQLKNKQLISGIALFMFSAGLYIPALRMSNLSIIYPTSSLAYVWAVVLGNKMLGEKITITKVIGVGLIICGIVILTIL